MGKGSGIGTTKRSFNLANSRKNLEIWRKRAQKEISSEVDLIAKRTEAWMKDNAAWNDRTGVARRVLQAEKFENETRISVLISYDVMEMKRSNDRYRNYAKYLEGWLAQYPWELGILIDTKAMLEDELTKLLILAGAENVK